MLVFDLEIIVYHLLNEKNALKGDTFDSEVPPPSSMTICGALASLAAFSIRMRVSFSLMAVLSASIHSLRCPSFWHANINRLSELYHSSYRLLHV